MSLIHNAEWTKMIYSYPWRDNIKYLQRKLGLSGKRLRAAQITVSQYQSMVNELNWANRKFIDQDVYLDQLIIYWKSQNEKDISSWEKNK